MGHVRDVPHRDDDPAGRRGERLLRRAGPERGGENHRALHWRLSRARAEGRAGGEGPAEHEGILQQPRGHAGDDLPGGGVAADGGHRSVRRGGALLHRGQDEGADQGEGLPGAAGGAGGPAQDAGRRGGRGGHRGGARQVGKK